MRGDSVLKALTVHAPWAWAMIHGPKRVENRSWGTSHRGPLAIHAGVSTASDEAAAALFASLGIQAPSGLALEALRGRVLGVVDVMDVLDYPDSGGGDLFAQEHALMEPDPRDALALDPFACGPKCWMLANPRPMGVQPMIKGGQGLWKLPEGLLWPSLATVEVVSP